MGFTICAYVYHGQYRCGKDQRRTFDTTEWMEVDLRAGWGSFQFTIDVTSYAKYPDDIATYYCTTSGLSTTRRLLRCTTARSAMRSGRSPRTRRATCSARPCSAPLWRSTTTTSRQRPTSEPSKRDSDVERVFSFQTFWNEKTRPCSSPVPARTRTLPGRGTIG